MHTDFPDIILSATGATDLKLVEGIQQLWSGYGAILRYRLTGSPWPTVVVKHVRLADGADHPRGWNTDLGHQRKLYSYQVETRWYQNWSHRCGDVCRVPRCLAVEQRGDETLMVLEDLDAAGFAERRQSVSDDELFACIDWLAAFHATFMNQVPQGLWPQGTYWHLDTRPDELAVLTDLSLKQAAPAIDQRLKQARYQTLVHGDAKLANFCFSSDGKRVAAVDFQYVGGGCGMKDLAYFIGSCLSEEACERREKELLDRYFTALHKGLLQEKTAGDGAAIEAEWRALYPLAWADFHRFLKGWSPGHWKINGYSERVSRAVVAQVTRSERIE